MESEISNFKTLGTPGYPPPILAKYKNPKIRKLIKKLSGKHENLRILENKNVDFKRKPT